MRQRLIPGITEPGPKGDTMGVSIVDEVHDGYPSLVHCLDLDPVVWRDYVLHQGIIPLESFEHDGIERGVRLDAYSNIP